MSVRELVELYVIGDCQTAFHYQQKSNSEQLISLENLFGKNVESCARFSHQEKPRSFGNDIKWIAMKWDTCRAGGVKRSTRHQRERAGSKETRVRLASFSEVGERGECWAALIDLGGPTDPARVRADRPDQPTIKLPVNIARPFSILLLSSSPSSFARSIILMSSSIPPLGRAHSTSRSTLRPSFARFRARAFSLPHLLDSPTPRVRYPINIYAVRNLIPRTRQGRKEDVSTPLANLVPAIST